MLTKVASSARVVNLIALYLRAPICTKENLKGRFMFHATHLFPLVSGEKCDEEIM